MMHNNFGHEPLSCVGCSAWVLLSHRRPRCPKQATTRHAPHLCCPAGAHATDIRNALKGHPMADQMADIIGPKPEPEAPAAEAAAPAEAEPAAPAEEAPKGLPSLGPKPKKKDGA